MMAVMAVVIVPSDHGATHSADNRADRAGDNRATDSARNRALGRIGHGARFGRSHKSDQRAGRDK